MMPTQTLDRQTLDTTNPGYTNARYDMISIRDNKTQTQKTLVKSYVMLSLKVWLLEFVNLEVLLKIPKLSFGYRI